MMNASVRPAQRPASPVLGARYSLRFRRFFGAYSRRLLRKRFSSVRLTRGSLGPLESVSPHAGPVIIVMNHPSWWDPILGMVIGDRFFPDRTPSGPVEAAQWRKFGFMKRLGLFGLDPEHHDAMPAMCAHVRRVFESEPRTVLGITPQGNFTDVRDAVRLRPGVAAIAAATPGVLLISLTIEYAFWNEQRPEAFFRAQQVDSPEENTTTAWHRCITRAMQQNADELARLVRDRDPAGFEPMLDRSGTHTNPLYDLWLRLRGLRPEINPRRAVGRPIEGEVLP